MAAVLAAAADAAVTFLWVLCASTLGAATAAVTSYLGVQDGGAHYALLVTVSLLFLLLFAFNLLCDALGGACFNPTDVAAFYAAGLSRPSLFSVALRLPAQAAGAVGGALAISELMPAQYKHMLGAPSLKVDPHTGAVAEGALTFVITMAVLWVLVKGPRNRLVKTLMLSVSTVCLILAGAAYTGPSMNPANAFGWHMLTIATTRGSSSMCTGYAPLLAPSLLRGSSGLCAYHQNLSPRPRKHDELKPEFKQIIWLRMLVLM